MEINFPSNKAYSSSRSRPEVGLENLFVSRAELHGYVRWVVWPLHKWYGNNQASRFWRAGEKPGILYASEKESTAIAETAYWRLRFFSRSPGFTPPSTTTEYTSFTAKLDVLRGIDLTVPPFDASADLWNDLTDYRACQRLAKAAREADTQSIRTISVRDPAHGCNIVVLDPTSFAENFPRTRNTWHMRFEAGRLLVLGAFPSNERFIFSADEFQIA